MTGLLIAIRSCWWQVSYYGHLVLLSLLALARFVFFGLAVLAHRWHTSLAAHGQVVADTVSAAGYSDHVKPRSERYARMVFFLLNPRPARMTDDEETR